MFLNICRTEDTKNEGGLGPFTEEVHSIGGIDGKAHTCLASAADLSWYVTEFLSGD
jgi:hypothetical protein